MTTFTDITGAAVADANEARALLTQITNELEQRLADRRAQDRAERDAREHLEAVTAEARREIAKCIRVDGTKSYLVDQDTGSEHQVSAPERDKWLEDSIRIAPEVVAARGALKQAEDDRATAVDALHRCERTYSAARADLAAAVAVLQALTGTETR